MDTMLARTMFHILEKQDSIYFKTDAVLKKVSHAPDWWDKYGGIIGIAIGALIGFAIGLVKDWLSERKERSAKTDAVKSKLCLDLGLLSFTLNELAYLYTDNKAQHYYAATEAGTEGGKRALEEEYSAYKYISAAKQNMAQLFNEVNKSIHDYYALNKALIPTELSTAREAFLEKIINLEKAKEFSVTTKTYNDDYENELKRLCGAYNRMHNDFSSAIKKHIPI